MKQIYKFFLITFLAAGMLFYTPVNASDQWECNDVKTGMWFYDIIYNLKCSLIMVGDGGDNFYPNRPITRGELVAIFARSDSDYINNQEKYGKSSFVDVDESKYYSQAVAWTEENGIVHGISKNRFAPDALVTREQLFVMTANYIQKISYPLVNAEPAQFIDFHHVADWAKESTLLAIQSGVVSGFPDETLKPQENVTRAQAGSIIYQLYGWRHNWF